MERRGPHCWLGRGCGGGLGRGVNRPVAALTHWFGGAAQEQNLAELAVAGPGLDLPAQPVELRAGPAERVVAEQERAASERLLHDILDSMNVSVSLNDREQRFLFMNKQYREFFMDPDGPKAPDGQLALSDIYAADRARTVTELNRKVWDTGEEFLEDRVVTAPDGHENVYRVQKFLLRDEKHAPYAVCSVATDITDRVRAEEERLRIEQKLQQQQRLESLGALAGGIAHDFNNLLVGMLGNAGLALEELPEDSPAHDALVHIESAATRASELTRQMLALSGHGRFHVEPIDLSTLARDTVPLVRSTVPNQTTLRLDLAPGLPAVDADATQLHHVVTNLLLNAAEAMAGHTGAITLRTGTLDLDRLRGVREVVRVGLDATGRAVGEHEGHREGRARGEATAGGHGRGDREVEADRPSAEAFGGPGRRGHERAPRRAGAGAVGGVLDEPGQFEGTRRGAAVGPDPPGHDGVAVDGHRQHDAVVVVHVLADEVHPPRCPDRRERGHREVERVGESGEARVGHGGRAYGPGSGIAEVARRVLGGHGVLEHAAADLGRGDVAGDPGGAQRRGEVDVQVVAGRGAGRVGLLVDPHHVGEGGVEEPVVPRHEVDATH